MQQKHAMQTCKMEKWMKCGKWKYWVETQGHCRKTQACLTNLWQTTHDLDRRFQTKANMQNEYSAYPLIGNGHMPPCKDRAEKHIKYLSSGCGDAHARPYLMKTTEASSTNLKPNQPTRVNMLWPWAYAGNAAPSGLNNGTWKFWMWNPHEKKKNPARKPGHRRPIWGQKPIFRKVNFLISWTIGIWSHMPPDTSCKPKSNVIHRYLLDWVLGT